MVSERVLQKINEVKKQQSERLDLSYQELTQIPDIVLELTSLTNLYLSGNQLTNIPESITKLTNLTNLSFGNNQLTNIPEFISELTNLTTIYLTGNQLTNIPESIDKLTSLTSLRLGKNQLTNIPEFIAKLTSLTRLDLYGNRLTNIPESITKLTSLTTIYLDGNQIKKIPSWLAEKKLEIEIEDENRVDCINLSGNPIEEPPLEIVKQGNQATLNYYSQLVTQGQDYLYEAKMLIVGEGGAGKTTLAHKIQDNNCPLPKIDDRTKGITINNYLFSVKAKNENKNRPFQLNIWDFGGQEIY
ncbi:MAG: leucine-rich repeat domain-containing protein, partial [Cyanobacteria bacterium P01_F01_bin.143]